MWSQKKWCIDAMHRSSRYSARIFGAGRTRDKPDLAEPVEIMKGRLCQEFSHFSETNTIAPYAR